MDEASIERLRAIWQQTKIPVLYRRGASNTGHQLSALETSAKASREQARATLVASIATDRLASAGQAQAQAVARSIDLAKEANSISRDASVAAQRPWLFYSLDRPAEPTEGQAWLVHGDLTNAGHSPASAVQTQFDLRFLPSPFVVPDLSPCGPTCATKVIFPGPTNWNASATMPPETMTKELVESLNSGTKTLVVRTRVDYRDGLGNIHSTLTCNYFQKGVGFTNCQRGNSAN